MICNYCGSTGVVDTIIYNTTYRSYCVKCKKMAKKDLKKILRIRKLEKEILKSKVIILYKEMLRNVDKIEKKMI